VKEIAFCFDLDGTVTGEEILPLIAREVQLFEEIDALTTATIQGFIPFVNSFKLRVKLLSSIPISRVQAIVNQVRLNAEISSFIKQNRDDCYIVTGNLDIWVGDFIARHLGCKYFSSKAEYQNDQLLGISEIIDKGHAVSILRREYQKIVTVGEGMNDCSMFEKADVRVAFGGVHDPVESIILMSEYVTYHPKSLAVLLTSIKDNYS
jgi:phosphoserine phosphatase